VTPRLNVTTQPQLLSHKVVNSLDVIDLFILPHDSCWARSLGSIVSYLSLFLCIFFARLAGASAPKGWVALDPTIAIGYVEKLTGAFTPDAPTAQRGCKINEIGPYASSNPSSGPIRLR
jgi:hypothetical protein